MFSMTFLKATAIAALLLVIMILDFHALSQSVGEYLSLFQQHILGHVLVRYSVL